MQRIAHKQSTASGIATSMMRGSIRSVCCSRMHQTSQGLPHTRGSELCWVRLMEENELHDVSRLEQ